jgi:PKD repeat protein
MITPTKTPKSENKEETMESRNEQLLDALLKGETADIVPQSRNEKILLDLINGEKPTEVPKSAIEAYLIAACEKGVGCGSGGSAGGGSEEWIGDGNTHIWITLHEGRTSPMLGVCPNGTVTVDWGDGTTPDVLTGTSTSLVKRTPIHEYADPGDYVIKLTVNGTMGLSGSQSDGAYILVHGSNRDEKDLVYQNSVIKVEIGDGVPSINAHAFGNCYSLASVVIPDSVTSIDTYAFNNCYSLTSLVIPDSVTSIGASAFNCCYSLTSLVIPDSVTSIGERAFFGCYSLASVVIPDGVTSIGTYTFNSCYSLASVVIPDSVTSIDTYAFNGCYSLTSLVIPDSVTSIGANAFNGCYSLASVVIPGGVTSIGNYTFTSCCGVAYYDFTKHTAIPTLSNANAFNKIASDCKIRVPTALYDNWIAATNWATYASKIVAV